MLGLALNCAYGVAQLAAQVGAGVNLDKRLIGPLTFGQGSLGGINVYGQATAVEQGSYVSLGVYRVNALALDPNHLGIMLAVPILLLLPFALRAGAAQRAGAWCWPALLAFFVVVEVLTLSRSGLLGLACGLLVLAWPLRRQLLQPRFVVPVLARLGLLAVALASSPYVAPGHPLARHAERQLGQGALPVLRPRPARARRASRASASASTRSRSTTSS